MRSWIGLLVSLSVTSTSLISSGSAQDNEQPVGQDPTRAVRISVYAPHGCPKADILRARLAARLQSGDLAPGRVVVTIEQTADAARLSLEVEIIDAAGVMSEPRKLSGGSCDGLLSAAALILSIALLPAEDAEEIALPNVGQEPVNDSSEPERPFISTARSLRPPSPVVGRIGAIAAIDGGTLPEVSPGIGVVGALTNRGLRVELAALYFPKRRAIADVMSASGGDLSALTTAARACWAPGPVAVCGGGEWSLLAASGFGTDNTETKTFFLWGLTIGSRSEMRLGERVAIAVTGELVGRPRRPEFRVSNPDRIVHRPGWLSVRFWLTGEVLLF